MTATRKFLLIGLITTCAAAVIVSVSFMNASENLNQRLPSDEVKFSKCHIGLGAPGLRLKRQGDSVKLQTSIRMYRNVKRGGPISFMLASSVHFAEHDFYNFLQSVINDQDLVLYEMIKAPKDTRAELTTRNLFSIGKFVDSLLQSGRELPLDMGQVVELAEAGPTWKQEYEQLWVDGWGNPIHYNVTDATSNKFTVYSMGDPKSPRKMTYRAIKSMQTIAAAQTKLASELELNFQAITMDYTHSDHIVNSDIDSAALGAILVEHNNKDDPEGQSLFGLQLDQLNKLLDDSAHDFEKLERVKLGLMFALESSLSIQRMEPVYRALIDDRNDIVIRDIERLLPVWEKKWKADNTLTPSVCVMYGAAHMIDLEKKLSEKYNVQPVGEMWVTSMSISMEMAKINGKQYEEWKQKIRDGASPMEIAMVDEEKPTDHTPNALEMIVKE